MDGKTLSVTGLIVTTETQAQGLGLLYAEGSICFSKTESWSGNRPLSAATKRHLTSVAFGQWFSVFQGARGGWGSSKCPLRGGTERYKTTFILSIAKQETPLNAVLLHNVLLEETISQRGKKLENCCNEPFSN